MANFICWICKENTSFQKYEGSELIDEEGNKACFECLLESGAFEEEKEAES